MLRRSPPVALVRSSNDRNLLITGWPLERDQFLEITSRMLTIAPRRSFKTLIRIFGENDEVGGVGQSKDFSLTGLAFQTGKRLKEGETVAISFSIPEAKQSMRLEANVVRSAPENEGKDGIYGARFVDLGGEDRRLLTAFILNS